MKQIIHNGRLINKWITEDGRVLNSNGNELKLSDNGKGYLTAFLYSYRSPDGKARSQRGYVHRLVALHYLENPHNLPQVNHKDYNKSNNHVNNLEWSSNSQNINHSHDGGRMQKRYDVGAVVYLTPEEVRDVYISVVTRKEGISEVGRRIGRSRTTISSVINKKSRRDITDKIDEELGQCH